MLSHPWFVSTVAYQSLACTSLQGLLRIMCSEVIQLNISFLAPVRFCSQCLKTTICLPVPGFCSVTREDWTVVWFDLWLWINQPNHINFLAGVEAALFHINFNICLSMNICFRCVISLLLQVWNHLAIQELFLTLTRVLWWVRYLWILY